MIKIERLKKDNLSDFHNLLLNVFDEGFNYYPEVAQKYNKSHWSKEKLEKYLNREDFLILTAWDNNIPVGYLIGKYFKPLKSSILWLGVMGTYQGRGIGTRLVKKWEIWSKNKGANLLKASTANFANEKFYKFLGFQKSQKMVKNNWGMKKLVFFKKVIF